MSTDEVSWQHSYYFESLRFRKSPLISLKLQFVPSSFFVQLLPFKCLKWEQYTKRHRIYLFLSRLLLVMMRYVPKTPIKCLKVSIVTISTHTPGPQGVMWHWCLFSHTHTHRNLFLWTASHSTCHLTTPHLCLLSHCHQNILLVQRQMSVTDEDLDNFRKVLKSYIDATSAHSDNLQWVSCLFSGEDMYLLNLVLGSEFEHWDGAESGVWIVTADVTEEEGWKNTVNEETH